MIMNSNDRELDVWDSKNAVLWQTYIYKTKYYWLFQNS